ncbi:MAG: radical SAM protein [Oscillospiraceae bacterium]|nr:radical SAM protein [Oscillospiraceae bacterium]
MSELLLRKFKESQYTVLFNRNSGAFLRIGQTESSPFFNVKTPELLDISITNYCEKGCDFCYRSSNTNGKHMSLNEYSRLVKEAQQLGVLQIALGGGNPNQHPDFINILEVTRKHSIIPSYTTNGKGMTEEIYQATKKYCGALAVSWYSPYTDALEVIEKCSLYGIKINIHYLLSKQTIEEAIAILHNKQLLEHINAIIFLNYKPIHTSSDLCLENNKNLYDFIKTIKLFKYCKVGFDSCMISYLTPLINEIKPETVDFCEAARFSAFISEDSIMYPCSFMCDTSMRGIDLKKTSIQDAWINGDIFQKIRLYLKTPSKQSYPILQCNNCKDYDFCHGGCQFFDINMCREIRTV